MKKRIIILTAMTAMAAFLAVGCAKAPQTESTAAETTTEAVTTEPSSESMEAAEPSQTGETQEPVVTPGIFKSEETIAENERQATFVDEYGNDFIANISEETEVPGEFKEGETYLISHSDMMTMSLPGIYPQVYSIELSDTPLETQAAESSRPAANP